MAMPSGERFNILKKNENVFKKRLFFQTVLGSFLLSVICCVIIGQLENVANADNEILPSTKSTSSKFSPSIHLKEIRLLNNTNGIVTLDELQRVIAPFRDKDIAYEQLEIIRNELTMIIISKGFVNSGAIIPDQEIKDGVVELQIIQGSLTGVEVEGNKHFSTGYFKSRIEQGGKTPLNINDIQETLLRFQQDDRIKQVNAELKAGANPGESELTLKVAENSPFKLGFEFSNTGIPSTGEYMGTVYAGVSNIAGMGDSLDCRVSITDGTTDVSGSYSIPFTRYDTAFSPYFRTGQSTVIETLYKDLRIKSTTDTFGVRIAQPLYRSGASNLQISLAGEYRKSVDSLLGVDYSFSEGENNGKSYISVLRFGQEYVNRGISHVFAAASLFSFGIDALGATIHDNGEPDGRFISWLGQVFYLQRLWDTPVQLAIRSNAQLTGDPLLAMEKFSVGGLGSVRGYSTSTFVTDNGVSASAEFRISLATDKIGGPILQFIPFYDFGRSWNNGINQLAPSPAETIQSVGAGVKWQFVKNGSAEVYYGYKLRKVQYDSQNLENNGVSFLLSWQAF